MKPSEALASNRAAIRHVVESHRARNARVFGSVLRGQDTESSYDNASGSPEVSLQDVLNGSDRVYVDLAPLTGLSGPERASFLKLSIAVEKPTGSVSQPSEHSLTLARSPAPATSAARLQVG